MDANRPPASFKKLPFVSIFHDSEKRVHSVSEISSLSVFLFRLSMSSLRRTEAGLYQCMVRNRMGAVIHRRTEVHVACK